MSIYPAPYESPPEDDLRAAVAGWMTVTTALILSWILGFAASYRIRDAAQLMSHGTQPEDVPAELLVTGVGWAAAVIFLVAGSLPVVLRKGRKAVAFGALLALVITVVAHLSYHYAQTVDQWPLYWGGVVVLGLALLPATRRWVHRLPPPTGETPIGTVPIGPAAGPTGH
jgi:hypothetical protein